VNEWETGPQFWPGANDDKFAVGVVILDGLGHCCSSDVLAQSPSDLEDGILLVRH
jgi:hypothetical protein